MNLSSQLSITEARRALDAKEFSARELAEATLARAAELNPALNAFLEVWETKAKEEAEAADRLIAHGESKPLTGIPIALKDNILVKGRLVSAASKILEGYRASYDATVTEKLKAQSAVFLGRTNCDEFAMGSSTENSAFGLTKHPLDHTRVPGGSSGGSAVAVATSMALGAFGSDTGGSIRQPASLCGVVGLKPTYGSVSRLGLIAFGSSLDQIGPFGKTVGDARTLFEVVRGYDERDSTSLPDKEIGLPSTKAESLVLGVPRSFLQQGIDADVLAGFEETLKKLKGYGYEIVDVALPTLPHSLAVYYIVNPAEASANLARFDGIRYGLSKDAPTIQEVYEKTRGEGFGPEVRRRILLGTFVLSSGYANAYYRKARAVRALIRDDFMRAFANVDAVVTPTSPTPAFKIGEKAEDPLAMYAADIFTVPVNLAGIPAISVPNGTVMRDNIALPTGFQIIGSWGGEETLFTIGKVVEKTR